MQVSAIEGIGARAAAPAGRARLIAIDGGVGAWIEVVVEHPDLPEVGRGEPLPVEQPALLRDGDRRLTRIVWGFEDDEPGKQD